MLKLKKITVFLIIFIAVIFLLPSSILAQTNDVLGSNALANSGLGTRDIKDIIVQIVNIFLGFLGILAVLIILYGGWIWMTSQGAADKIDKAKKIILNAVIGLIIILASYAIARFIIYQIYGATGGGPGAGGGPGGGYHGGVGIGGGVIENHYPARNASDVPRNTNIYITFKEAMKEEDLITDSDCDFDFCANPDNIILTDTTNDQIFDNSKLRATLSADKKVLGLNPYDTDTSFHLGNQNEQTNYNMALGNEIKKENGDLAFGSSGYDWNFMVSSQLDLTPPTVTSVIPVASSINPRNTVVQINFSESMNPLFAAGVYDNNPPDFTNITVAQNPAGTLVQGQYLISNQYKTVEFLTNDLCGTNSCGGNVYCLPANNEFLSTVTDNLKDMADNILDGNDDGTPGGSYSWSFSTNNTIDLTPPEISKMENNNNVELTDAITIIFNKSLLSSSINSSNIDFIKLPSTAINYWLGLSTNKISIFHDKLEPLTEYQPNLSSGIQDSLQNCFNPCECNDPTSSSCVCNNPACFGANCFGAAD